MRFLLFDVGPGSEDTGRAVSPVFTCARSVTVFTAFMGIFLIPNPAEKCLNF